MAVDLAIPASGGGDRQAGALVAAWLATKRSPHIRAVCLAAELPGAEPRTSAPAAATGCYASVAPSGGGQR